MPRVLLILVVIAAVVAAAWYLNRPQPVEVRLHSVARGSVENTVANTRVGTVKACRRAYLAPATGGQVATLAVKEGQDVERGDVLLEVWNDDLRAEVALAEAEAVAARARALEACATATGAEREAKRVARLGNDKLISEETVDLAQTRADASRAACQAAHASSRVSEARIAVTQSMLERTIVRAPFPGTVAEVNAELGGYVTPSPPGIPTLPAVDLLDVSCLYVSAPIDEVDAPAIRTGMEACVSLDAYPGRFCSGVVRRIAPYVLDTEKQARTVEVEVELSDPSAIDNLLPGYSADIEVRIESHDDVLRVPTEAVIEGDRVLIYDPQSKTLQERTIERGLHNWDFTEVRAGLAAGDRVVLSVGKEGVEAGAPARPEPD